MAAYGSLTFAEQIAFFRQKLNLPTQRWDDLLGSAHDRAFVVAGAAKADLLADLRAAVTKAIEQGTTLAEFRKDFDALVARRGWTGWTGEGSSAGRAWRTRIIYETNLRTSYAAGRWAQIQQVKADRPYLLYRHNDNVIHPRPVHQSWDGKVIPADDPWWQTHFPPNGWGCQCRVQAVGEDYLRRMGKAGPDLAPTAPDDLSGIDRGWDYAPGATWHPDLDKYPYAIARELVASNMRDGVFERWHDKIATLVGVELIKPGVSELDQTKQKNQLRKNLSRGEEYSIAIIAPATVSLLGVQTQTVKLSDYDLIKQQISRYGQDFDALRYLTVQGTLDDARLIVRDNDQITIFLSAAPGQWYAAVLQQTKSGRGLYLKSYRRSSEADARTQSRKGVILKNEL